MCLNSTMKIARSLSPLVFILFLGAILRFWHLDSKPLWMDEIITALFSFGRSYYDVPLEQALPISAFEQVFRLNLSASCPQIVETVSVQSVHPPLFFCWMHSWLKWSHPLPMSWIWQLRALPALFGVGAIAAVYQFSAVAFSKKAGILSAIIMAISPFGIYLSQEARHYTLPVLLITLALLGLYYILLDIQQQQIHLRRWVGWVITNSVGFYVHYFFLLAFAAQIVVLLIVLLQQTLPRHKIQDTDKHLRLLKPYIWVSCAIAAICLTWLPWLPTFFSHINRPETDWIQTSNDSGFALLLPLVQLVMGLILMLIALPVENQPGWMVVLNGSMMVLFAIWLARQLQLGIQYLWQEQQETKVATQLLLGFILAVLLEFLAIAYLLGKDLTQVPRYNFIYFPAFCALSGAALSRIEIPTNVRLHPVVRWLNKQAVAIVLLVSILSTTFVLANQVFQKPYLPEQIANRLYQEPATPLLVVGVYNTFQDIALELSFAIALKQAEQELEPASAAHFALMKGDDQIWQRLTDLQHPLSFPLNLWIFAPGLRRINFSPQVALQGTSETLHTCALDSNHYYRLGIPYQLYRCS